MAASPTHFHRYFSGDTKFIPTSPNLTFEFNEFDIWNITPSPDLHQINKSVRSTASQRSVTGTGHALSLPVDVPDWCMILKQDQSERRRADSDEYDDVYGDVIPPHEYLARVRTASFSVHEGVGRTLKGRDLSRVRDAVWKQIGFED